jgi:hypothetical protein
MGTSIPAGSAGTTGSAGTIPGTAVGGAPASAGTAGSTTVTPAGAGAAGVGAGDGTGAAVPSGTASGTPSGAAPRSYLSNIARAMYDGVPFGIAADEDPATAVPGDEPGQAIKSATVRSDASTPDSRTAVGADRLQSTTTTARPGTAGTPAK